MNQSCNLKHDIDTTFLRLIPINMEELPVNFQPVLIDALQEIAELMYTYGTDDT